MYNSRRKQASPGIITVALRVAAAALRVAAAALLLAALAPGSALPALAQSGGPYDLTWSTVDGVGAMVSAGGYYALGGTAGQPDADLLAGGSYTLLGGFWGGAAVKYGAYLPLVVKP